MSDGVLFISTILAANGHPDVNYERLESRALSSPEYIFVQEAGGSGLFSGELDSQLLNVVVYGNVSRAATLAAARKVREDLFAAYRAQTVVPGAGHLAFLTVEQLPTLQQVAGLPGGVYRYFAAYTLGLRP